MCRSSFICLLGAVMALLGTLATLEAAGLQSAEGAEEKLEPVPPQAEEAADDGSKPEPQSDQPGEDDESTTLLRLAGPRDHLIDTFVKDRGAKRLRMKEKGYEALAVYTADYFDNVSGGISQGGAFLGNLDLLFTLDAEKAFGWNGWLFFVYVLGTHGDNPSERAGDAQGLDNIAAPSTFKFYELLGEVRLGSKFSLLAGLYDLNSEFDVIDSSQDFINSSFGIGVDFSQSGRNGPSIFPITSFGLRAKIQPSLRFYLQAAALDGVPGSLNDPSGTHVRLFDNDGALFVGEGGWLIDPADDHPPEARRLRARRIGRQQDWRQRGKVALGAWTYSKRQDVIGTDPANPQLAHSWGAYLLAEKRVYGELADAAQGLDIFGRVGVAEDQVNRFGSSVILGLSYTGPFGGRDDDSIGLAFSKAFNGDTYKDTLKNAGIPVDDAETAIELTYVAQVQPWLRIQPDLQYIINPGTDPGLEDAFLIGLRVGITF